MSLQSKQKSFPSALREVFPPVSPIDKRLLALVAPVPNEVRSIAAVIRPADKSEDEVWNNK